MHRRTFVQYSGVLAGSLAVSPLFGRLPLSKEMGKESPLFWYQKPLRIMHTVLREIDAKNYDANAVVDYLKKGSYNTLCVNAGGIVDFFQNPLPAANVNLIMGNRDILKEITTACKAAGIKVIARIDFRGVEEHVYQKFPDWFKKDTSQNPVRTNYTKPVLYESCYLGQYRNEYANEFVRYVLTNYAVDGIWHNAPGFGGICYCSRCREAYKATVGKEIPVVGTASEEELDRYMTWKTQTADQYMDRIRRTVKSFGQDKVYTAEVFSIYGVGQRIDSGIDLDSARKHFDILVSVAFLTENSQGERFTYEDLNYGSTIIKFLKSMVPDKEAVVMYGGNGTTHRLVMDPPLDLKVWLWEILSAGGRFWNCYFTNVPTQTHDNRNAFNETEAFQFVKANEELLVQHVPVANIGIYYSNPTRISYRSKTAEGDRFGAEIRGVESVLMENHIPHDFILDDQVSKERLQKYKLVILPNVRCMADKEIEVLKNYVREGGNLVATYSTSLCDTRGNDRADFGLSELFGVRYAGKKENTRKDNYQYILDKGHPLVKVDSPKTELLFTAGYTALTKPRDKATVICTWVPAIPNQPPDKAWVREFSTAYPTIVENKYGKGTVFYFANQPDLLSYETGHPDPRNLLLRTIRYLAGTAIPIETNAPSSVHIGLTTSLQKKGQYNLTLVNTTSGMFRPIRELVPVHDIKIKLKLDGRSVGLCKVLRSQSECHIKSVENTLDIHIPKLADFCAIHVQMTT
ncbi:alpha-amylase family protein [Flavisolibacter nicotianae]|uniref:alpha-amylase family protein n=1 Tax=Flavisolibacter nicotianae TaxID=2364882 RepID=UPI000EAC42E1|nr:alpha-amylase family protein [Flavisolibacter nicotianae]